MRLGVVLCCLCLFFCGCSLPLRISPLIQDASGNPAARLMNIRIERWGEPRFSGLLALRQEGNGLYYALLDATGVKLLEVVVAEDGGHRLIHAKGALKDSGLDGFLAEVLARTYLQEPATLPCAGTWLYRLCREEEAGKGWRKYGQAGPLEIWQVGTDWEQGPGKAAVMYRQPWLGVRIFLEATKPAP
ncbi:MAG: hypothetical protein KJ630_16830 [Proteobacteria bacterium]|nr:hypothetical protein [Pseudomonadota bacterium]